MSSIGSSLIPGAQLLARLNPGSVRYDSAGAGGVPALTRSDISAALALCRSKLGVALLAWAHGQDMARPGAELADLQCAEWLRRERAVLDAMHAMASVRADADRRRAQRRYARAMKLRWPAWLSDPDAGVVCGVYGTMRQRVLHELREPAKCHDCSGRGEVRDDAGLVHSCKACGGTGRAKCSGRARARALGVSQPTWRRQWEPVFDWTVSVCEEAMRDAAGELRRKVA